MKPTYIDDTLIVAASNDMAGLVERINALLEQVYNYACCNLLKINASKSKVMVIGEKSDYRAFVVGGYKIRIGHNDIENVHKIRYLGVTLDKRLLFKEHAGYAISKISCSVNYLSR